MKFSEVESFDLVRAGKGAHIAFGSGIHHCVGSSTRDDPGRFGAFLNACRHRGGLGADADFPVDPGQ